MKKQIILYFITLAIVTTFSCSTPKQEKIIEQKSSFQSNSTWLWILTNPENTEACQLWLSFADNGTLKFGYRGFITDGTYRFDTELPQYMYIHIPERPNWNDDCVITPWYLSLYNDNSDFEFTQTEDFLYLRKMDKVLKFRKEIIG